MGQQMKKLINTAFIYAILAMVGGVFYREFTKFNGVEGGTSLAFVHTHLFMLGMFFFLIILLLEERFRVSEDRRFKIFYLVYNTGLIITTIALIWRGITQVFQTQLSKGLDASISGIAGIGHILLAIGIVLLFFMLKKVRINN